MICPLSLIESEGNDLKCREDDCAWYDSDICACAVLSIAQRLIAIDGIIAK